MNGFDETSKRRLRFHEDFIEGFFADEKSLYITGPSLEPFKMYFSNEQFSKLHNLFFLPIRNKEKLEGFILFSIESKDPEKTALKAQSYIPYISPSIIESRKALVSERNSFVDSLMLLDKSYKMQKDKGLKSNLSVISVEALVKNLCLPSLDIDYIHVYFDLLNYLGIIIGLQGAISPLCYPKAAFLYSSNNEPDIELILFQLSKTMSKHFNCDSQIVLCETISTENDIDIQNALSNYL